MINVRLLILALWMLSLGLHLPSGVANDNSALGRWFEVEVILFTREIPKDSIREEFTTSVSPITFRRTRDLLTKFHYPDIRPLFYHLGGCSVEDRLTNQLKRQYQQLPNHSELQRTFAHQSTQIAQQQINSAHQLFSSTDRNSADLKLDSADTHTDTDKCGEPLTFTNWYRQLTYPLQPRHQQRSFAYHYDMYPRVIFTGEPSHDPYVHLASPANFQLREIYRTLRRQPDIRPILHTTWRQPGVSPGRSRATRLYAGHDFSQRFNFQGEPQSTNNMTSSTAPLTDLIFLPETLGLENPSVSSDAIANSAVAKPTSVVDNIEQLLAQIEQGGTVDFHQHRIYQPQPQPQPQSEDPHQVREIDGLFRIYIDKFNYLHIDAEFNLRREVAIETDKAPLALQLGQSTPLSSTSVVDPLINRPLTRLANYHFKQKRRVISKQLHYFDHPYMGMIVQIRRYGW